MFSQTKTKVVNGLLVLFLLFFWLGMALFRDSKVPFSILSLSPTLTDSIDTNYKEIHAGQIISGKFTAQADNIGILAVRFNTYHRINSDFLVFRIKEKGEKNWYYQNLYKVDQFQPDDYFTFGFPLITNSQSKTYIFQLESTIGKNQDAVAISSISPALTTRYQIEKNRFLHDKKYAFIYTSEKFIEFFSSPERFLHSLVFILPLFLYLLWLERKEKKYIVSIFLACSGLFLSVVYFLSQGYNQFLELLIALIILILRMRLGWSSKTLFTFSFGLFILSVTMTSLGWELLGNKQGILFYYLLCIGTITMLLEKNLKEYLVNILKKTYKLTDQFLKTKPRRFFIIIGSIPLGLYMFEPVSHLLHKEIWLGWGYSDYLVKNLDPLMSPFSAWRDIMGEPTNPRIFDFLYYLPLKVLLALHIPGEVAWIVYVYAIFLVSFIACTYFVKKIFPQTPRLAHALAGLLYTSFIPLNYELGNFGLKINAAFIPLVLLISYIILDNLRTNRSVKINIVLWFIILLISANFFLLEPRGFLISIMLFVLLSFYYILLFPSKRVLIKTLLFTFSFILGLVLLCLPIQYTQNAIYSGAVNLAAPIQEAVYITNSFINYLIFQPSPILPLQSQVYIFLIVISILLYVGALYILKNNHSRKVLVLITCMWILYMLFLNSFILQQLVTHIPFGQLFRSWRLSQYLGGMIIALLFLGLWLSKSVIVKILSVIGILTYFALSILVVNSSFLFVKTPDIMPYLHTNIFLSKDIDRFKVLWTPEMGDSGSHPFWTLDAAQTFPEFMSSKPTYSHNDNGNNNLYVWLATALRTSEFQNNPSANNLLNILGIKYLILHDDINNYASATAAMKNNIASMKQLPKVFSDNYISVYKNNLFKNRLWITPQKNTFICYEGLRCLSDFYKNNSIYSSTTFLADETLPHINYDYIYNPDNRETSDIQDTLLINELIQQKYPDILLANNFFANLKAVACASDTHQGGYHMYWQNNQSYDFAGNFTPASCFFLLLPNKPNVSISHQLQKGDYTVVIRYMKQINPSSFSFTALNTVITIDAGNANDNYYTYKTFPLHIYSQQKIPITLHNIIGNNFISLIAFIPQQKLQAFTSKIPITSQPMREKMSTIKLQKIVQKNSATWEMDANIREPVILNFAETYNPLWKVIVTSSSGQKETVYATEGYGMINSFPISIKGDVRIHLVYEPQEKFFQYMLLSIIGVMVLGGVFYITQIRLAKDN